MDLLFTGGGGNNPPSTLGSGFAPRRNTAATVDPRTPSTPVSEFAPLSLFSRKVSEPSSGASTAGQPVSLFATCMILIEKLYSFPLFEFYLFPDGTSQFTEGPSPAIIEPINVLWAAFRLGAPLCMVYNQLAVTQPLNVADVSGVRPGQYGKLCKDNVYRFVIACRDELRMPEARDFTTSELYKDDTHGFFKVLRMVQEVVSRIEAAGMMPTKKPFPIPIPDIDPTVNNLDNRLRLIKEMVDTERSYVASLEVLQRYMKECELLKVLTKDDSIAIFANLNELLDFQRRFVIAMESMLALPAKEQRIGQLFIQHEMGFSVYRQFCSNYSYARQKILGMMESLRRVANIIEPIHLQGYLIKPVQRVSWYPLLLQELLKVSDPEKYSFMEELKAGLAAVKRVTETINEENLRKENIEKKEELFEKVEDWKGLNPQSFGALVLSEKFLMTSNDHERQFDIFLFDTMLLCCQEIQQQKKTKKRDTGGAGGSSISGQKYTVRGSIKISAIKRVASEPIFGAYSLRVFWDDGADMVQFSLKCRNGEQVRLWKDRIERLVAASQNNLSSSNASSSSQQQQQRSWGRSLSGDSATAGDQMWDPMSSYSLSRSASPAALQTPNTPSSAYGGAGGNVYGYPAGWASAAAVSATQAMLAAAAAGVAPPVGLSDDEDSDGAPPVDFSDEEDSDGDDPKPGVGYRAPTLQQQQLTLGRPFVSGPNAPVSSRFAAAGLPQRDGSEPMQQSVGRPSLDQPQPRTTSLYLAGGGLQVTTTHAPSPLRRALIQQSSTPSTGAAAPAPSFVKIKTYYQSEVFMIAVPLRTATISDLVARLERKIRLCGNVPPREQGRKMWMAYRPGGVDADPGAGGDPASDRSVIPIVVDADVKRAYAEAIRAGGTLNMFVWSTEMQNSASPRQTRAETQSLYSVYHGTGTLDGSQPVSKRTGIDSIISNMTSTTYAPTNKSFHDNDEHSKLGSWSTTRRSGVGSIMSTVSNETLETYAASDYSPNEFDFRRRKSDYEPSVENMFIGSIERRPEENLTTTLFGYVSPDISESRPDDTPERLLDDESVEPIETEPPTDLEGRQQLKPKNLSEPPLDSSLKPDETDETPRGEDSVSPIGQRIESLLFTNMTTLSSWTDHLHRRSRLSHAHATNHVLKLVNKHTSNGESLLRLRGPPGAGLSTLLVNAASALGSTKLLAAFFCASSDPASTDPKVMVLTLLSELCRVSSGFTKGALDFLGANDNFLSEATAEEIFEELCTRFPASGMPGSLIIIVDTGDCYDIVAGLIRQWRHSLPPSVSMLISANTDTIMADDLVDLKPTEIHVPSDILAEDILDYTKAYLQSLTFYDDAITPSDAVAAKLTELSGNNFTNAVLAEHYVKLVAEPLTAEVLDSLQPEPDSPLSVSEHLVACIFHEYFDIPSVQPILLAKVLRALAARAAAIPDSWTTATLAAEVEEAEPAVSKLLRQLGPLVAFRRGPAASAVSADDAAGGVRAATAATVSLFSSLMAASVRRLDEAEFFDLDGDSGVLLSSPVSVAEAALDVLENQLQ
ncbi:hypothetical protein HK405_002475, partial [Cladochytrium tenue]